MIETETKFNMYIVFKTGCYIVLFATTAAGVFDFKADRFNELLTIYETPGDGPNHKQLLKKLRKVDKRARIVKKPVKDECSDSEPQRGHCMVLLPDIMTPWIPAGGMPVWPFFPNFHYVQHPVSCGHCLGYSDVVCSNCGRRSEVGALKE